MGYLIYWNLWIICKKFLGLNVYTSNSFNKFMNYRKELYEWNFKKRYHLGSKLEHCYWVSFKGSIANLRKISQSVEGTFECLLSVFSIQPYFSSPLCCFLFVTCWRNPKWNCIVKMTRITPTLTSDAELWLCMVVSIIRTSRRNQCMW